MVNRAKLLFLITAILTLSCGGDNGGQDQGDANNHEKKIYKTDYGADWPFSVEGGVLKCDRSAILFLANGKKYAVNGTAKNWAKSEGYDNEIEEIWLPGTDIGRIIRDGLKLCE